MTRPPGKSRSRGLSKEDEALWGAASQAYEPLKRVRSRVLAREDDARAGSAAPWGAAHVSKEPRQAGAGGALPKAEPRPPSPAPKSRPPPLAEFDQRKAKKLAAGREAIDARIDLHGMRQSEAHAALRSFLLSCHADGRRNVLVITGKGGPGREEETSLSSFMDSRERGVLRRNVPQWLGEPELRAIVVSYQSAAQPHGGGGALYVHLRARRRTGDRR